MPVRRTVSYVEVFIDPDDGRSLPPQPGHVRDQRHRVAFVCRTSGRRDAAAGGGRRDAIVRRSGAAKAARFDLRAGRPDLALFPFRRWRRCTTAALQATPPNYGDPVGDPELRTVLAHWIGRTRGVVSTPADVVVTSGALHGLDLTARAVLEPGQVVAVEEPGYPPAVHQLRVSGYSVVGVPVDEDGLIVDAIPNDVRLVYVTPSHQFPLGAVLSHATPPVPAALGEGK